MDRTRACTTALTCIGLALAGCATPDFRPSLIEAQGFSKRLVTQTGADMTVSAAVVGPEEAISLLGIDLYGQDIQPIWLRVENSGTAPARVALASIDDEYFSPLEVAWMSRRSFKKKDRPALERWIYEHRLPRRIPAGELRSGLVFVHESPGTKGFNVDIHSGTAAESFTFFLPLPGFVPDFMNVDFRTVYSDDDVRIVELDELRHALESLACCSFDPSGAYTGDPLNIALVGTGIAVRRALLRAGWTETAKESSATALARTHHFEGRPPDGTFHKLRPGGPERRELRLWLAPVRVAEVPVWIGQASSYLPADSTIDDFDDYEIDPDVDGTRMFVVQDLWYGQSLSALAHVHGAPSATVEMPAQNFHGARYVTDGRRAVLVVSEEPVGMDETVLMQWAGPPPR